MQTVFFASAPAPSLVSSAPTVMPPPAPSAPVVAASTAGLHCTYCQRDGHRYQDYYKRRRDKGRRSGRPPKGSRGSSHSGASVSRQGSSSEAMQQLALVPPCRLILRLLRFCSSGSCFSVVFLASASSLVRYLVSVDLGL